MIKIASITVTSKRHKIIGTALDSVKDQVDAFIFVDLGIDTQTNSAIFEHTSEKPISFIKADPKSSMSDWRNIGIAKAQELGFDWALQLDTDEKMIFGAMDLHETLAGLDGVNVLSVLHESGSYSRERFFRLPTTHKYKGCVHEYWDGDKIGLLPGVLFDEKPKTEEQIDGKMGLHIKALRRQMRLEPWNHRWPFYLAMFYRAQGNYDAAKKMIFKCLGLEATPEAKAWDCYIASMCCVEGNNPETGLRWSTLGLQLHPGLAELSFVAGVCCLRLGKPMEALCWANMAISNGLASGSSFAANRLGFREPFMLLEGPFQMQADCMKAMGYPEEKIQESLKQVEEIKEWRTHGTMSLNHN